MAVPEAKVAELMATITPAGGARSAGLRTLRALSKQDGEITVEEANLKLVCALKELGAGNVNISTFKQYSGVIEQRETVKTMVWLLQRTKCPELDKREGFQGYGEQSWLHDPAQIASKTIDKSAFWFIDINCPTVPKGANQWELSMSLVQKALYLQRTRSKTAPADSTSPT